MGHSSSGLTLFGPSALHFYQGPSSTGLSLLTLEPSNPNSHISRSIHVSQTIPSSSPLPNMMSAIGSMDSPMHAPNPVSHTKPINAS